MALTLTEQFMDDRSELQLLVSGSLDTRGAGMLVRRVAEAFLADVRMLVIDLAGTNALDLDGVKALISLRACAIAAGVGYELAHAPPLLRHVIRLASLDGSESMSWTTAAGTSRLDRDSSAQTMT